VITAWRIVKAKYAETAFDGESAAIAGGRWNSQGNRVIYTSESAALATLELLVHMGRSRSLQEYLIFSCSFSETLVDDFDTTQLPDNWRTFPGPPSLKVLGDQWIANQSSAILRVPSVVIETDSNYLLNPAHRDFKHVTISPGQRFELDLRLLPQ